MRKFTFVFVIIFSSYAFATNPGLNISNINVLGGPTSVTYAESGFNLIQGQSIYLKGGVRIVMQNDGNFVIYLANGTPVWNTGSNGTCDTNACKMTFQNDGNLVVYYSSGSAG